MTKRTHTDNKALTLIESHSEIDEPSFYHVIFINDDYTPMEFVILLLIDLFDKEVDDAQMIMMQVHTHNRGIAGTYPKEIAQEKVKQVKLASEANEFPLNCIAEHV